MLATHRQGVSLSVRGRRALQPSGPFSTLVLLCVLLCLPGPCPTPPNAVLLPKGPARRTESERKTGSVTWSGKGLATSRLTWRDTTRTTTGSPGSGVRCVTRECDPPICLHAVEAAHAGLQAQATTCLLLCLARVSCCYLCAVCMHAGCNFSRDARLVAVLDRLLCVWTLTLTIACLPACSPARLCPAVACWLQAAHGGAAQAAVA